MTTSSWKQLLVFQEPSPISRARWSSKEKYSFILKRDIGNKAGSCCPALVWNELK
ncbi:hypothetical protein Nmel_005021 [Mimus melanotis]